MRRAFWYGVAAYWHWRDMMEGAKCRDLGMTHTDPPCAYCARRAPFDRRWRDAAEKAAACTS